MKLSKEDWHQEWCDGQCEQCYCDKHRFIYQDCQSAHVVDHYQCWIETEDGGECQYCRSDLAYKRLKAQTKEFQCLPN